MADGDPGRSLDGRGYGADDRTAFNAFGVISWDERSGKYEFRGYGMGFAETFPFTPTPNGYVWNVPAGPASRPC